MVKPLSTMSFFESSMTFAQSMFLPNALFQAASNLSAADHGLDSQEGHFTLAVKRGLERSLSARKSFSSEAEDNISKNEVKATVMVGDVAIEATSRLVPASEDYSGSAGDMQRTDDVPNASTVCSSGGQSRCSSRSRYPSNPESSYYSSSSRW